MQNHFQNVQILHAGKSQENHECRNALQHLEEADYNHDVIIQDTKERNQMVVQPIISTSHLALVGAREEKITRNELIEALSWVRSEDLANALELHHSYYPDVSQQKKERYEQIAIDSKVLPNPEMGAETRAEVLAWILDESKKDLAFKEWVLAELQQIQTKTKEQMDAARRAEVLAWLESLSTEELEWVISYLKTRKAQPAMTA